MKKILFFWGFLFLSPIFILAQRLQLETIEWEPFDRAVAGKIISDTNYLIMGGAALRNDTVDFDFINNTFTMPILGISDAFWGKYRKSDFGLEQLFIISGIGYESITDIELDDLKNVYVLCLFDSTNLDVAPLLSESYILNTRGGHDFFVAKYNSQGNLQWARQIGGNTSSDRAFDLELDESGNVYLSGMIGGNVTIDSTATQSVGRTGGYQTPIYAKYNNSGTLQWLMMVNSNNAYADYNSIKYQEGHLIISGIADSPFSLGGQLYNISTTTSYVAFVDSIGAITWADTLEIESIGFIETDSSFFYFTTKDVNNNNIYLYKYDFTGTEHFCKTIYSSSEYSSINDIVITDSAIFLFGSFYDTLVFDSVLFGSNIFVTNDGIYRKNIFVAKTNKIGEFQWVERTLSNPSWGNGGPNIASVIKDDEFFYASMYNVGADSTLYNIAFEPSIYTIPRSSGIIKYRLNETTGTEIIEDKVQLKLKLYPNPTQNMLMLQSGQTISHVIIYDLAGRPIQEEKWYGVPISLSGLTSGVYIVVAYNQNGQICGSEKLIKMD